MPLESFINANKCDSDGYTPECYVARKRIANSGEEDIIPYIAEGATRLESLQSLYLLLAQNQAVQDLSNIK